MKPILNKPELVLKLQQQLEAIQELCAEYDAGNELVINSIAERILLIFHNSDHENSLLTQLKLNHILMYCGSEAYNSKSLTNFIGLLRLEHNPGKGWGYLAKLDQGTLITVSQENWWQNKKVIVDSGGISFTRAKIIKSIMDVDPIHLNTSGWVLKDAAGKKTTINPIPEAVRQIAFELLETFRKVDLNKESKLHYKP
jgi:hypothetical protein